ncbi:hypothetical protein, partial [Micromonospora sp. NPDC051296]|uniref:hypothetical protein n=1 Tax=Micromonospora sp. NPDC051296 TaxID=3155046 RepID=UPI0034443862
STFRWAAEEARRFSGELQRLDTDPAATGRIALRRREREVNATVPASSDGRHRMAGYRHVGPLGDQPTLTDR